MENIAENLNKTRSRIIAAEQKYGRAADSVRLLAVSKTHPPGTIRAAVQAGQRHFGENYVQEAVDKIHALAGLDLVWHFIGPIQSNKTRLLAEHFDWVHSLDRIRIAKRLSEGRPAGRPALNVCIQVNISGESTKSGVNPSDAVELASEILELPGLKLRGLMVIPAAAEDFNTQRQAFRQTRLLLEQLNKAGIGLDTLSMGMSDDLEAAIAEGATIVRVGTAIFGARQT
jgi:pyridoxal phosphate enzyme (YggS family)